MRDTEKILKDSFLPMQYEYYIQIIEELMDKCYENRGNALFVVITSTDFEGLEEGKKVCKGLPAFFSNFKMEDMSYLWNITNGLHELSGHIDNIVEVEEIHSIIEPDANVLTRAYLLDFSDTYQ